MSRIASRLAASFGAALLAVSGSAAQPPVHKKTRRTIVGSLNGAPDSLDPAAIIDSAQWHTLLNMGVNLVAHDRDGRMVGEAAQRWTISPDLRVFTFDLIDGVKDSDGKILDSSDWKATFLHLLRSGGSTHSFISEFLDESGIETPSPSRLVLRLKKPYQTFMQRLTTPEFILLSKRAISKDNRVDLRVASGAYRLKGFDSVKGSCSLSANPYYLHASPEQIPEVIIERLPDSNMELVRRLATDEWNFSIASIMPTDPSGAVLEKNVLEKKISMRPTIPGAVGFVLFFDTPRLHTAAQRLALAKLIGAQAEKDMNRLTAKATHQIYPPGFVGALPPDREKQLFEEIRRAGSNANLPRKLIGYGSNGAYVAGMPQWVQRTLSAAGVKIEPHELAYTTYQSKQKSLDHDYVVVMTGLNAKDPAGSLLTLLSPKSGIIPDPDGKLDALLQKAVQADSTARSTLLHDLSEALLRDGRIVPFVHYGSSIVSSPDVIAEPPSQYDDELRLADIRWRD